MAAAADRCSKLSLREVVDASAVTGNVSWRPMLKALAEEVVGASAVPRSPVNGGLGAEDAA